MNLKMTRISFPGGDVKNQGGGVKKTPSRGIEKK
jgi:hypothetical protein